MNKWKKWSMVFIGIWIGSIMLKLLTQTPIIHECPKLMASMVEAQPIIGCLI